MINILNKLTDKQISCLVESDAKGKTKIIIPINDDDITEIEIFKNNKYIVLMTSPRPITLPTILTFQTELEVIDFLFKEEK